MRCAASRRTPARNPWRPSRRAQPALQRLLGEILELEVDRRVDAQPELGRGRAAEVLLEEPPHVIDVPGSRRVGRVLAVRLVVELFGQRLLVLLVGDELLDPHAVEHVVLPIARRLREPLRVVLARALRQTGEQRGLGDREVLDVDVEEGLRRGLHAIGACAEVDLVHVQIEDVVLAELVLEAQRQDDFLHLAFDVAVGREEQGLHHLLRDGAAALLHPLARQVGEERAGDAEGIDARVAVEVGVLRGEEGRPHVGGHAIERHQVSPFDEELAEHGAVFGEDLGCGRRLVAEELIHRREVLADLTVDDVADRPRCHDAGEQEGPEEPPQPPRPPR